MCVNNRTKNTKKCTHMTAAELKTLRREMGLNLRSMSFSLDMPYRTYQDYEYARRSIPQEVAISVRELYKRDRQWMADFKRRLNADLDRTYPNGIPSAPAPNEEE